MIHSWSANSSGTLSSEEWLFTFGHLPFPTARWKAQKIIRVSFLKKVLWKVDYGLLSNIYFKEINKRSKSTLTNFKSQYSTNIWGHSKSLLFKILECFVEKMHTNKVEVHWNFQSINHLSYFPRKNRDEKMDKKTNISFKSAKNRYIFNYLIFHFIKKHS